MAAPRFPSLATPSSRLPVTLRTCSSASGAWETPSAAKTPLHRLQQQVNSHRESLCLAKADTSSRVAAVLDSAAQTPRPTLSVGLTRCSLSSVGLMTSEVVDTQSLAILFVVAHQPLLEGGKVPLRRHADLKMK